MTVVSNDKKKAHETWIDIARIVAILLVLLCHSTEEGLYSFKLEDVVKMDLVQQLFPFCTFTLGRLGVPIFLFITGFLLLTKEYDDSNVVMFLQRNWLHLIICTQIWVVIYDLFLKVFIHAEYSVFDILKDVLFLRTFTGMPHLWYMPMIIGLYGFLPFIANGLNSVSKRTVIIPLALFFIWFFVYPMINILSLSLFPGTSLLSNQISQGFTGGVYGAYLIIGGLLKDEIVKKMKNTILIMGIIISFVSSICFQIWCYQRNVDYTIYYNSPLLLILATCIFILFSRIKIDEKRYSSLVKAINWISGYTFSIYLIHYPVKLLIIDVIKRVPISQPLRVMVMWVTTFLISLSLAVVISKIPRFGNYVLYRKSQ